MTKNRLTCVVLAGCAAFGIWRQTTAFSAETGIDVGNGAQLYKVHGGADLSARGREQSAGIMVNYLYDLARIEENHDAYFDSGRVAASKEVQKLAG